MDNSATPLIPFYVSHEEFTLFHRIDRELYRILVINLYRDPSESMQVLAMWLWLERVGYRCLVKKITFLPYILIDEVAEEIVICLNHIKTWHFSFFSYMPFPYESNDILILQNIVEKEIFLPLLYENGDLALQRVAKVLRDVCSRAFGDILRQAIIRNTTDKMVEAQKKVAAQNSQPRFWFGSNRPSHLQMVDMVGGNADHQVRVMHNYLSQQNNGLQADDRTLLVMFYKGYPVEELEVLPNEQALFARIVFRNLSTIDMILRWSSKAKFGIKKNMLGLESLCQNVPRLFCQ